MRILDRYILKTFLIPFLYCFFGFVAIWLLIDLTGNMGEFTQYRVSMKVVGLYYLTQAPFIIVMVLPVALLLALLYSLSRMSRSNELISMLVAGQSLTRLIVPLMGVGAVATVLSFAMNYEFAPHAETAKKDMFDQISRGQTKMAILTSHLFRNRADHRTWFVQIKIDIYGMRTQLKRSDVKDFFATHITQQDADGNITRIYYTGHATFDERTHAWIFEDGKTVDFDLEGNITHQEKWPRLVINNWSETPWRIISTDLDAQNLSVPELENYLKINSDFPETQLAPYRTYYHYLIAVPFGCMVVVLIASPLGIVYSRRGVLAGVASSVFIFFGMMFFDKLFLAFGKHGSIPAVVAAWGTNAMFMVIGLYLLYIRSTNREFFKWDVKHLLRSFNLLDLWQMNGKSKAALKNAQ